MRQGGNGKVKPPVSYLGELRCVLPDDCTCLSMELSLLKFRGFLDIKMLVLDLFVFYSLFIYLIYGWIKYLRSMI